jgi:hypothetical protein
MQYNYFIHGIHCASCITKITNLLQTKFTATDIVITDNSKLQFNADAIDVTTLNKQLATIGEYTVTTEQSSVSSITSSDESTSYKPIYLIFAYLIGLTLLISIKSPNLWMSHFMAGFFIVFSFFKVLDLKGFADGYSSYDLIAKKFYHYGYIYPFLELIFGIAYIVTPYSIILNLIVFVIMFISVVGVIKVKLSNQKFYCACVGTFLKIPLGNLAIIENTLMLIMAGAMLIKLLF